MIGQMNKTESIYLIPEIIRNRNPVLIAQSHKIKINLKFGNAYVTVVLFGYE